MSKRRSTQKFRALRDRAREAIWDVDPIGVGDSRPDVPDEYDELATRIAGQLLQGNSPEDAVADLSGYLQAAWGVSMDRERIVALVDAVRDI